MISRDLELAGKAAEMASSAGAIA